MGGVGWTHSGGYGLEEASEGAAKGNGEGGFSLRMGGARCRDRDEVYDRG